MTAAAEFGALPVPVATKWSEAFWEGLREGRFLLQACDRCGTRQGYPKPLCKHCGSAELSWSESTGRGSVYTHTTVEANPPTPFTPQLPYTLVVVELNEGVRYLASWSGSEPPQCGMAVEAVYEQRADGTLLPAFAPARR